MKKNSIKRELTFKIIFSFLFVILLFFIVHYIYIRRTFMKQYIAMRQSEVRQLAPSLADAVYVNDIEFLKKLVYPLSSSPDAVYILIADNNGDTIFSQGTFPAAVFSQKGIDKNKYMEKKDALLLLKNDIILHSLMPTEFGKQPAKTLGSIEVVFSLKKLIADINSNYILIIPAILVVFLILYLWLGASIRFYINPILLITQTMLEHRAGETNKRVKTKRTDEIGELAEAFNSMADELQNRMEALKTLNKELDLKVTQRTKEIQQKNELLEQQNKEILRADRLKSEFLANVSHELRTPLNSILGFSQVLLNKIDGDLPPKQAEDIRIIYQNGKHLLDLINDILDLSKIEAGKIKLNMEYLDVCSIIKEVENALMPLAETKHLTLTAKCPPKAALIFADYIRLKQILFNLLSNALKFTNKGGVRAAVSQEDHHLNIEISDSGIGIAREDLDTIFEAFTQVKRQLTAKPGGTGLGLTLAKKYTELMNGKIKVRSTLNVGTTFTLSFPYFNIKNDGHINIAVIEDDPDAVMLYSRFLQEKDVNIIHFTYSKDLIHKLEENNVSLIILDILIPREKGWDVLKLIKASLKIGKVPVIVISILDKKKYAVAMGADAYLLKPVTEQEFLKTISKYVKI